VAAQPAISKKLYVGFPAPPAMAKELTAKGANLKEQRNCYRLVRDEIRAFVEGPAELS
jgi:hypothetical protein